MQYRKWNLERFIFFQTVILQRAQHFTTSHAIRRRIEKRPDAWGEGKHAILVENTLRTCSEYLTFAQTSPLPRERRWRITRRKRTTS